MNTQLDYEYKSGLHLIYLRGDLSSSVLLKLKTTLSEAVEKTKIYKVLINLAGVEYITSKDLGVFVQIFRFLDGAARNAESSGDPKESYVALCNLNAFVNDVIELTKLGQVFRIFETEQEALSTLK